MRNPFLKPRVKKESVVEQYLVKKVTELGGEVRKAVFPGRNGAPDRLVLFPGGVVAWVELKSETGKLRPEQEREHERFIKFGQRVVVIRTKWEVEFFTDEWYRESCRRIENS